MVITLLMLHWTSVAEASPLKQKTETPLVDLDR